MKTKTNSVLIIILLSFVVIISSCSESNRGVDKDQSQSQIKNPNGRNDTWGFVGPGGGGAMFSPTVSPHDPNHAFVSCDMTGSYVTHNGGKSWRMFNLRGVIRFYVFDPNNSNTIYARSSALFRSTDGGDTWQVVYPHPSEIVGIVSKGDHAHEFMITKDSAVSSVLALAVDPDNSRKLYAAIDIKDESALYISEDWGETWLKKASLKDGVQDIFIDPSSPENDRKIYVTTNYSVQIIAGDQTNTNPGPKGVKRITAYAGGFSYDQNKFILYAMSGKSYFNPAEELSGIFRSENGGKTWINMQEGLASLRMKGAEIPEWRAIATCATKAEVLYISYANFQVSEDTTCIGVAKSTDYGTTWNLAWKDKANWPGATGTANMEDAWLNERFGPGWGENPFAIGVAPNNPNICYTTDFGRTIKTTDGGVTWQQLYTEKQESGGWRSTGLQVTTNYMLAFDPYDSAHILMANTDTGLMESKDGGYSWSSATFNNGVPRPWYNSTYWLAFDLDVENKVYAVMSRNHDLPRPKMFRNGGVDRYMGGVLVSENGAKNWNPVSEDIGEAACTHILIDPESNTNARVIYVCAFGKGVYKSNDGGSSWTQKNKGIEGNEPFAWRITRRSSDGTLFLVVSRRSDDGSIDNAGDGALYRSENGAESWTRMTLPQSTNGPTSLLIDPEMPDRLILSAWGRPVSNPFAPDIGGGIFISEDDGKSWGNVLAHDQHIHDVTMDERNGIYYACGFNASAYRSEDRGNTWRRIKGYNFKWGKRVEPDPYNPEKIYIITFGGGVWYGPALGDPEAVEDILTPILAYDQY